MFSIKKSVNNSISPLSPSSFPFMHGSGVCACVYVQAYVCASEEVINQLSLEMSKEIRRTRREKEWTVRSGYFKELI